MRFRLLLLAAASFAVIAVAASSAAASHQARTFSAHVTNPWFPLIPGSRYVYNDAESGLKGRDVVFVTHRVRTIQGAPSVAVSDKLYLHGRLRERTTDYYTQAANGTVWYYGESTAELDKHGHVTSREGTWLAGKNGAKPGIFMPAHPVVGRSYRQEFLKGHAEDHFKVIGVFRSIVGSHSAVQVLTKEWSPLEPGVIDHKMYTRGIGNVFEQTQKGPNEHAELISLRR
jgi:hypothetical protein